MHARKMNILVYADEGVGEDSISQVMRSIRSHVSHNYAVQKISADQLINEPWENTASLFVMPGGRDLPYVEKLKGKGNERLKSYVQKGGKYLGLCAGAYYAAELIEYALGTAMEIKGPRELGFFPGKAVGPAFGFEPKAMTIEGPHLKSVVYYEMGPEFIPSLDAPKKSLEILMRFEGTEKAAVVKLKEDEGIVLLSSVHPEFDPMDLSLHPRLGNSLRALIGGNPERVALWRYLLQELELQLEEPETPPELTSIYQVIPEDVFASLDLSKPRILNEEACPKLLMVQKEEDVPVDLDFHRVVPLVVMKEFTGGGLNYPHFKKHLQTKSFGRAFLHCDVVTSTQTILQQHFSFFKNFPNGLTFTADRQVQGKGRGNNAWVSPKGCLMFSLLISHRDAKTAIFMQYLVSLALVGTIRGMAGYKDIDIRIKWPNDIYYHDLKLGGVVVHSNWMGDRFYFVVGVGLNVWNGRPTTSLNHIVTELNKTKSEPIYYHESDEILALFLNKFEEYYQLFEEEGFTPFLEHYYKYWMHTDEQVNIQTDDGISEAKIRGLTPSGFLAATDIHSGEEYELHPDGNSFDIMRGLIVKKVA